VDKIDIYFYGFLVCCAHHHLVMVTNKFGNFDSLQAAERSEAKLPARGGVRSTPKNK
jgi:hypothetical protein